MGKAIRRLGQWGGSIVFYGNAVVWIRELLTRPDRDVFVDMIGSVVSLHSLYIGAAVGSSILAVWCSRAVFVWAWKIKRQWEHKRHTDSPSHRFKLLHDDIVREFNHTEREEEGIFEGRSDAAKYKERESLRFKLSKLEISPPNPAKCSDIIWYDFITHLAPLSEDGRIDEARDFSDKFRRPKGIR